MFNHSFQQGFTIIELIMVIISLGVLAAIAIPMYEDFSTEAQNAAINNLAGALSSANSENYAIRIMNPTYGQAVTNCTSVGRLLAGKLPDGYRIKGSAVKVNITKTCTLRGPSSTTAQFTATGIK